MKIVKAWWGEEFWYPESSRDKKMIEEQSGRFNKVVSGLGQGSYRRKY